MSQKHAFVIYAGASESGRVFHALTHAKQAHARGDNAEVYFAAEGTQWPGVLADASHPMHGLFDDMLRAKVVKGACKTARMPLGTPILQGQLAASSKARKRATDKSTSWVWKTQAGAYGYSKEHEYGTDTSCYYRHGMH